MRKHSTLTSALLLIPALLGAGFLGLAAGAGLSVENITIRLIHSGAGGEAADDITWDVPPWKCCDVPSCTSRDIPPSCFCADLVDSCDGCKDCIDAAGSRYMCADMYRTYPPPRCTERLERPWACCDDPRCTLTCPTICHCDDTVASCAAACKECQQVESDPPRYRCIDAYAGSPWPRYST